MNNLNKYRDLIFDRLFSNLEHNENKKEVILIYGPNATGKSTLFNFIIDLNLVYKQIISLLLNSKNEDKDKFWIQYFLEADDIYDDKLVEELNKILKENVEQNILDSIFLKIDKRQILEFMIYKFKTDLISKIWQKENNVKVFKAIWRKYFDFCKIKFKQAKNNKHKKLSEIEEVEISHSCLEESFNSCGKIFIELSSKRIDVSYILKILFKKWIKNNKKQIEYKIKEKIECDDQKLYEYFCTSFRNEIDKNIDIRDWQSLITATTTNIFPYSFVHHIKNNRNNNSYFSESTIKKYLTFSEPVNNIICEVDKIIFSSIPHLKNNFVKLKKFMLMKMKQTSLFHKLIGNKNDIIHFIFEAKQSLSILIENENMENLINKIDKILELMGVLYKNNHNSQNFKSITLDLKEIIQEEDKEIKFKAIVGKINNYIRNLSLFKLFYSESEIWNEVVDNNSKIIDFLSNIKKIDDSIFNVNWLEYFQKDFVWWTILFILKEYIINDKNEWNLSLNSIIESIKKINDKTFKNSFEELTKIYDDNDFKINIILSKFQNSFNIDFNLKFLGIIDWKILGDKKFILEILKYKGQDFLITNKEIINKSIYSTAEVNSILFLNFYLCNYLELNSDLNDSIILIDDGGITFDNSKVFAFSIFIKELIQIGSKRSKYIIFSYDLNFFSLLRRFLEIDSSNENYKLMSCSMRKTRISSESKDKVIIKPMQELDFIELFKIIKSNFNNINNLKLNSFFIKCKINLIIIIIRKILSPFNDDINNITSKHLHSYFSETKIYKDVLESIQNILTKIGQPINIDYNDTKISEICKDNYIDFFKQNLYEYINSKTSLEQLKNEEEINIFALKINLCLGCRIMLEEKVKKEISIIKSESNEKIKKKWKDIEDKNKDKPTEIVNRFLSETNKIQDNIKEIYKSCNYHLHYNPYLFFDASLDTYMEWYKKIYEFSQDKNNYF